MHAPQERLSFSCSKCLPSLFGLVHRYISLLSKELTLNGFQIGEFVHLDRAGRTGVLIVYVVSGYVQMGPFGSERVRARSRLCEFVHMFLHGVSKWR